MIKGSSYTNKMKPISEMDILRNSVREKNKEIERLREEHEAFRKKLIEMLGFEPVVDYPLK